MDVPPASRAGIRKIRRTPRKGLRSFLLKQQVCHEPGVTAVAVRKGMDPDESMVESRHDFIEWEGPVLQLRTTIKEQIPDRDGDFFGSNAKILLRQPERTGPSPGSVEHVPMQLANEFIVQYRKLSLTVYPTQCFKNVFRLIGIELGDRRHPRGNQPSGFIRIQWGRAGRVLEL